VIAAGLDPDNLPSQEKRAMSFENRKSAEIAKAWRDIWGAGQSLGAIGDVLPASEVIARMRAEYLDARRELCTSAIAQARRLPFSRVCRNPFHSAAFVAKARAPMRERRLTSQER
jgi:hypothetical protein